MAKIVGTALEAVSKLHYDLGVNSYVVKPVDFNALADLAHNAGYYWLAINRTPTD